MSRLYFVIFSLMLSTSVFSAGFDCKKASTDVEKMICADKQLNKLDSVMMENFKTLNQNNIGDNQKKDLLKTQKAWLSERNRCSDQTCLKSMYLDRLDKMCDYANVVSGAWWGECLTASDLH